MGPLVLQELQEPLEAMEQQAQLELRALQEPTELMVLQDRLVLQVYKEQREPLEQLAHQELGPQVLLD
jgi:hypothetical protein